MRIIGALLKPLSFLPAIVIMYMIFSFSSQDGVTSSQLSYKVSYKIVETGAKILGEDLEPWEIDSFANRFHTLVRKAAHMTEYFALAVSVAFPLYVYGMRGILLMLFAGFICVAFACGDEYHQSMVAGRSPSERDVMIDSIGIFFGIILVRIIGWTGRKTIFRPFTKESINKRKQKRAAKKQLKESEVYYKNPDHNSYDYERNSFRDERYSDEYDSSYPDERYSDYPYPDDYYDDYDSHDSRMQDHYVPDKLSEDMSFRKLVHELKGRSHS